MTSILEKWKKQIHDLFIYTTDVISDDAAQEMLGDMVDEFLRNNGYSEKTGNMLLNSIEARNSFYEFLDEQSIKIKHEEKEGSEGSKVGAGTCMEREKMRKLADLIKNHPKKRSWLAEPSVLDYRIHELDDYFESLKGFVKWLEGPGGKKR